MNTASWVLYYITLYVTHHRHVQNSPPSDFVSNNSTQQLFSIIFFCNYACANDVIAINLIIATYFTSVQHILLPMAMNFWEWKHEKELQDPTYSFHHCVLGYWVTGYKQRSASVILALGGDSTSNSETDMSLLSFYRKDCSGGAQAAPSKRRVIKT